MFIKVYRVFTGKTILSNQEKRVNSHDISHPQVITMLLWSNGNDHIIMKISGFQIVILDFLLIPLLTIDLNPKSLQRPSKIYVLVLSPSSSMPSSVDFRLPFHKLPGLGV